MTDEFEELKAAVREERRLQAELRRAVKALNIATHRRSEIEFHMRKARREARAAQANGAGPSEGKAS